ncbi:MAG: hypothetical protein NVSMB45_00250 [Ginsengibacter sp.]
MSTFLKIIFINVTFLLINISALAHKCDSKISNKSQPCSTHLSNASINKTIAATSLKVPKNKLLDKHKNSIDDTDRNYFICPACHM